MVTSSSIHGDVSSCKTEIAFLNGSTRTNIFTVQNVGYATNNCTGHTDTFNSWSLSGFSIVLIGFFVAASLLAIITRD